MPLPDGGDKTPWPPKSEEGAYMRYSEHSAWYDGSPLALAAFYGGYGGSQLGGQSLGFFNTNLTYPQPMNNAAPLWRRFMFWAKQPSTPVTRVRLHNPIAADIATRSADLLFSEEPEFFIEAAHVKKAEQAAKDIQDRMDELATSGSVYTALLEAAEVCAALGGVFLKVGWDMNVDSTGPMLTAVHADAAVPEFSWGRLQAVTFWQVLYQDKQIVRRWLERHEPGVILHGLYEGTAQNLGRLVPLTDAPETQDLVVEDGNRIETGIDRLTAVYIPNMRPNRDNRASSLGRSDYAGSEGLMDALDETYTSWIRDLRLGRARLIVPQDFLRSEGRGKGADFDADREVWMGVNQPPTAPGGATITENQFQIRTQDHLQTALNLTEQIVAAAGYSASTFGLRGEGTIKTATEIAAREQMSLVTRGKKAQYWGPQLASILETLLMLDAKWFKGPGVIKPRIDFSDSVRDDPKEIAAGVQLLLAAKAASVDTRVRMVHPDWGDDQVEKEVALILGEDARGIMAGPTTSPGPGGTIQPPGLPSEIPDTGGANG